MDGRAGKETLVRVVPPAASVKKDDCTCTCNAIVSSKLPSRLPTAECNGDIGLRHCHTITQLDVNLRVFVTKNGYTQLVELVKFRVALFSRLSEYRNKWEI